jgi:hypothetical protein
MAEARAFSSRACARSEHRSRAMAFIHETIDDLHAAGVMDRVTCQTCLD